MNSSGGSEGLGQRKVAVIGAGMAGLCTLRHFAPDPNYAVVAFERMSTIAGIWNYPAPECEQFAELDEPETSSRYCRIYRDLRTNSPRDLTGYPDFPFPKQDESYVKREMVVQYYHKYAKHFDLLRLIKFRHQVSFVKPIRDASGKVRKWHLEALDLESGRTFADEYDIVVVCNGHYHKPNIPKLEGIENFRGRIIHSSQYRIPEPFTNKIVLVIGARSSAMDIACELIPYAKQIIVSRRFQASVFKDKFPNVTETTELTSFGPDHVVLRDGSIRPVDEIVLCTGFVYDFPFLSPDCNVHCTRGRVYPLYRHLIHCENPSLAFVGLANMAVFSHVANAQVQYYKAVLDGRLALPSTPEMLAASEKDLQDKLAAGSPEHLAHEMTVSQWDYMERLAKEAEFPSYEPSTRRLFELNIMGIRTMPYGFRNFRMEKIDRDNFVREPIEPGSKAAIANGRPTTTVPNGIAS
ncbi:uncharacterized protein LOC129584695 [Paramacrobiotus metropolitanus]|uniref:uncharacterized protein LOC129584695 n=1 Tax=Paramacrobiotus metropolitanus TaxID=2943436 RepID=UPI0024459370|nr:uncharacterized protein LOC129584695 [Paramacrobiotus metropolitanus]